MAATVGDMLLERLHEWGVRRIFGYPGDGINGIMGAFGRAKDKMQFVQARHEELAAFMATAHAKLTGEIGVCLATSGPGAIHLLNGLYDAKLDHTPVLAIVGQQKRTALGGDYQQEVDLPSLFKDVAHEYVHMATDPGQVRTLIDRAIRIAYERRTVTCLIFPNDVQGLAAVETPPREHGTVHTGVGRSAVTVPDHDAIKRAADVLNQGERLAILVGQGAMHATDEIIEVAERMRAGVAKALLGKAVVPDDLPYVTGSIGLLGTKPSWDLMEECDTFLMVGSAFPYSEFLPPEGKAKGVQIDIDGRMLSLRYPMEVNLVGDAKATLRALIPHLSQRQNGAWREKIERNVDRWWKVLEARAMNEAEPINPQRIFWELSSRLPENCIVTTDSGSGTNWYARDLKLKRGMMGTLSGGLATMGPSIPYAIAAKYAYPDRHVIALQGDGAFQMNGVNGLITIAKAWKEKQWGNGKLTVMVLHNNDLNQVTWEQRVMEGDPKFEDSQNLPDFPYAGYAELLGLQGIRVDDPDQIGAAWERALASEVPTLIEFLADPDVPPLPPHIRPEQAKHFMAALMKGDPNAMGLIRASAKEWWDGTFAG